MPPANNGKLPKLNAADSPLCSHAVYSMYSGREKWFLVSMVAVAGLFSPLPANIYFPAIPTLTTVFDRSVEDLNLTVTVYLVMQGVSPMLWGPLSDRWGRRPLFLVCLAILTSASIGLALCPTSAYWLLLLLRIIQAGGCASTIALGAGVIGDIATNEERGGYFGMFNLGPMLAPCIGPAIGGALSQHLGWRSIFWFLAGFSGACFVLLLLFLPETLRALVGNGEIKPKMAIYRPVLPVIGEVEMETPDSEPKATQLQTVKGTMNPFQLLTYPDIVLTLTYTGIVYAVNYTITATISSSFAKVYPYLSETSLGLCYLTTGAGMILGSTFIGKFLDFDYARIKRLYLDEQDQSSMINSSSELENFPLEYARLRSMPLQIIIFSGCAIAWGWCLEKKISIAGPLVLQVALGWTSISILNATMTLMIDIVKKQSSSVIACTNLIRCSLAAVLVSVTDKATKALGYGWTYVILGAMCLLMLPLIVTEIKLGRSIRNKRRALNDD